MKKFILKLDLHDDKEKRKAFKTVSMLQGIDSIAMDMKERKLTVIGTVDPVSVASKLRKYWPTEIIMVGPAKEPEKKEEAKKEDPKKEEPKKEGEKKEEAKEEPKKEEPKKEEPKKEEEKKPAPQPVVPPMLPFRPYYPPMYAYNPPVYTYPPPMMQTYHPPPPSTQYHVQPSMEENPNACVIL